jgi:hypothetical protein
MNRPDFVTLHMNARRHRSRLMGDLIASLVRRIRFAPARQASAGQASAGPAARGRTAGYPMPQQ